MSYERDKMLGLLYRLFQAEEWLWFKNDGSFKIPSFEEIEKEIDNLESSAYEVKGYAESGRIKVVYDKESQTYEYYLNLL